MKLEGTRMADLLTHLAQSVAVDGDREVDVRSSRARGYKVADNMRIRPWSAALMLMIAGCAGPTAVQESKAPAPPPVIVSFDGSYRTTIRVTGMAAEAQGTNWCETPGQPVITVSSGQFSYAIPHPNVPDNPTPVFQAALAQDGSFAGGANNGTIAGQVRGPRIVGTINGEGCVYAFAGDRI